MGDYTLVKKRAIAPNLVVNDFVYVQADRNRKDVGTLKNSILRAEAIYSPNRVELYDTYRDMLSIDGHLSGIWRKRFDTVLNKSIKFVDAHGHRVASLDGLINTNKFNRLIEIILQSKAWGLSGVEFVVGKEFNYVEIDRKHIHSESRTITTSQWASPDTGLFIGDLPFVFVIDNHNLGGLLQCMMYAIYKRAGFGDYAQFVEVYGQPVRIITYDAYDEKTKQDCRRILDQAGSSLAIMLPSTAKFSMMDGKTSNGNGDLQLGLIKACNDEMSIAVLGNTETTTSSAGSGYAQSKTQSDQQLEITKSDLTFVQNILNEPQFLNILRSYGYEVEGGHFEFEMELELGYLKARLAIDTVVSTKVPYADDYWYQTYGISKP